MTDTHLPYGFAELPVVVFDGSNFEQIVRALRLSPGDGVVVGREGISRSFVVSGHVLKELREGKPIGLGRFLGKVNDD